MKYKVMIVEDQTMPRELFELRIQASEHFETALSIDFDMFPPSVCFSRLLVLQTGSRFGSLGLVGDPVPVPAQCAAEMLAATSPWRGGNEGHCRPPPGKACHITYVIFPFCLFSFVTTSASPRRALSFALYCSALRAERSWGRDARSAAG